MTDRHTLKMIIASLALFYIATAYDFIFHQKPFDIYLTIIGSAIALIGFALRVIAHDNLRENFAYAVRINRDHTLVTDNIHRYIRHPMYTGMFLLLAGIAVIFSSWYGAAVLLVIVTPIGIYRTYVEEKALTEHFGNQYVNYCFVTKRFVPYIL